MSAPPPARHRRDHRAPPYPPLDPTSGRPVEPNDFDNLADLARTLNAFERHWNEIAEPFDWNFTRDDLAP